MHTLWNQFGKHERAESIGTRRSIQGITNEGLQEKKKKKKMPEQRIFQCQGLVTGHHSVEKKQVGRSRMAYIIFKIFFLN